MESGPDMAGHDGRRYLVLVPEGLPLALMELRGRQTAHILTAACFIVDEAKGGPPPGQSGDVRPPFPDLPPKSINDFQPKRLVRTRPIRA